MFVAPESLHVVLETLKEELKFSHVMISEQVLEGDLLIDFMRYFRRSISAFSAGIPSSIEEGEGVLQGFSKS